jgi:SAM-dependent methyltransferase
MEPEPSSKVTDDFRSLDFDSLWAGREATTTVERAVLGQLLEGLDPRRVLEVGPGAGRLTPVLRAKSNEYVALDLHSEFLGRIPATPGPARSLRVVADAHHAPFRDGSFTIVVVVRVYNFLPDPLAFLKEMSRLLAPGGRVVIGYQPRPSLATLVDDYRLFLSGRRAPGAPTMTFSNLPQVPAGPEPFPTWLPTRSHVRASLARSGFVVERALSTGVEDYAVGRRLPPRVFIGLAPVGDPFRFLPTQFVRARSSAEPSGRPLPDWTDMLACPGCRSPFGTVALDHASTVRCSTCGRITLVRDGWVEARPGPAPRSNPPER